MNVNIAICDDENIEIQYLTLFVKSWADSKKINADISDFESAESFLSHYSENKNIDILLLDIQMSGLNGIELAKQIRIENNSMQIIFITGFSDFMAEGYDVSALHYLMKPVKEEKLFEVLDKAVSFVRTPFRTVIFPKTGGDIKIKADDIIYAEVLSHTTTLYHVNGKEEFQIRISDMEKLLGDGFFKCHRSYIVSMKYVRRVTKSAMILESGHEIPLSRSMYDAAIQEFIRYN